MKRMCFLLALMLGLNCNFANAKLSSLDQYLQDAKNENVQVRTAALIKLNHELEIGAIQLNNKIIETAHELIKAEMNGTYKYQPEEDGENLYKWQLEELAIKINDQEVLPYLFRFIDYKHSREAIVKQGAKSLDALIRLTNNFQKMKGGEKRASLQIFKMMIENNADNNSRGKIKERTLKILRENDSGVKTSITSIHNTAIYIKQPVLDIFRALGDKDLMPVIEEVSKNDQDFEEVSSEELKFKRMSMDEKQIHLSEVKAINEKRKNADAENGKGLVKYYPVREYAVKVLEELKKKNGM